MTVDLWFAIGAVVFVVCALAIALIVAGHWADLNAEGAAEAYRGALEARLSPLASGVHVVGHPKPYDREKDFWISNYQTTPKWVPIQPTRAELDFVYGLHLIDSAFDHAEGETRR